jgi:acyl-CoA reductase-like NAD-dependent aldehyde dehydrogenase
LLHLPLLRAGRAYSSLSRKTLRHVVTGEPVVAVSQASPGLVARDLAHADAARQVLAQVSTAELLAIADRAATLFADGDLPVGDDESLQSPADYRRQLSATTGLPLSLATLQMGRLRAALENLPTTLTGLSGGLSPVELDAGHGRPAGVRTAIVPTTPVLGAVLPNNSPGVHGLWQPALALRTPVALKPGGREPWTPYRLAAAWMAAGCPPAAWSLYPGDVGVATELLLRSGRALLFGDATTTARWAARGHVAVHGPGWSKVMFGLDQAADWPRHLDLLVTSIAGNGGRSCLNASGIWLPREAGQGRALGNALASRLAAIVPRSLDDPAAALAAFPDAAVARAIDAEIERGLAAGGAVDLTAELRGTPRLVTVDGCTFLQPTLVLCDDPDHPLARAEYLFPFAAVVEVPAAELATSLGQTLVLTLLSEDPVLLAALAGDPRVDKLNLGAISTLAVDWQQPHEGNLFDLLYRRRALTAPDAHWRVA